MEYSFKLRLDESNQWIIASITDSHGKTFNDCVFKETNGLTADQIRAGIEASIHEQLAAAAAEEAERAELASRRAALNTLIRTAGGSITVST